jgi:hypothetical protein
LQAPDPVFFPGFLKTGRLLHEDGLRVREDPVEKSRFDVKVLYVPIKGGSDVHQRAERLKTSGGSGRLIVVNAVALSETFDDITYFVPGDVARIIPLPLTDKLPFKGSLSTRDFRTWHQYEDLQVRETAKFIAGTSDPILAFRRSEGGSPKRVIIRVKFNIGGTDG